MNRVRLFSVIVTASFALQACSGGGAPSAIPRQDAGQNVRILRPSASSGKIQHVIIMVQENRTFNNLFATFPGTTGATTGYYLKGPNHVKTPVALTESTLPSADYNHDSRAYNYACDGKDTYPKTSCMMDGFNLVGVDGNNPASTGPYQYVNPMYIKPYWAMAKQYGIADHMFQTQGSASFTAHQDLIEGGSMLVDTKCGKNEPECALIDLPNTNGNWGCSAKDAFTNILTTAGQYVYMGGPAPCLTYPDKTMPDLLDAAGVSWKYYAPPYKPHTAGAEWNAAAALSEIYNGPDWKKNVSMPQTNIFNDISGGTLPAVSWLIPTQVDSDHPHKPSSEDNGPDWVGSVVNAVGQSPYWNSTAIVVTWDDFGGFFDPVPPAFFDDQGGLGFRVPMLVISPYVKAHTISTTQYEFASILVFTEDNFGLGRMGSPSFPNNDSRATSIADMFDFSIKPRKFTVIPTALKKSHFMHERIIYEPIDDGD
ncbi:MAG TPA: alkaline phosphatase family protein [Candidatus Tumulicola sp.]|jgi:phospholipase C